MCQCKNNNNTQHVTGGLIDWNAVTPAATAMVEADPAKPNTAMPAAAEIMKTLLTYRTPQERFLTTLQLVATVLAIIVAIRVLFINKN